MVSERQAAVLAACCEREAAQAAKWQALLSPQAEALPSEDKLKKLCRKVWGWRWQPGVLCGQLWEGRGALLVAIEGQKMPATF